MNIDSQAIATIIAAVISLFAGAALFRFKLNAKKTTVNKIKGNNNVIQSGKRNNSIINEKKD
ncbi:MULTISPECIES: hypothetical protein [Bacillus]|uniref:hypothetical protein n=1 Tax=Bacillus TaxID=1386 RepID=UPI00090A3C0A|nr:MULTISPECIES: hypothetical protein [Bacillus]APH35029.1 hypothetical protein BHE96_05355 [Bacillus subtilis]AUJ61843.1 hypothetical protein B6257_15320 [Bacillus velezensis]AVX17970.1 hypothetical protein C5I45_14270 [Bacillus sp. ZY-1-1]AZJ45239.1 hypothetical protein EG882_18835 [Bacillus velezensis]MDF3256156.1 hypothetical protein [Bacillus velezensis]